MASTTADGTIQSTRKALLLLKHVGMHHGTGVRLTDLIGLTGFDKSTAHRLLGYLVEEGFVERIGASKRYRLGIESIQLGFAASDMAPLVERFRPLMHRVARISEDTVFFVVRSGDESVYVDRLEGAYPVKAFVAEPGKRRLLGFSAVGVCMLVDDSDKDIAAMYERHAEPYGKLGMTLAILRAHIRFARKNGYSELHDFGPAETAGVGCAFQLTPTLKAGISIAAIRSRMDSTRMRELGRLLQREIAEVVRTTS